MNNWLKLTYPAAVINEYNVRVGHCTAIGQDNSYACAVVRNDIQQCYFIYHLKQFDGKDLDFQVTLADSLIGALSSEQIQSYINLSAVMAENYYRPGFFDSNEAI